MTMEQQMLVERLPYLAFLASTAVFTLSVAGRSLLQALRSK
ncbi:MAG: hypothetical protein AB1758_16105 [Candidatus Eremiobacterota bacterium]